MLAAAVGPASYVHHPPLFLSLAAFPSLSVYHVRVCRAQRGNAAGSGGGSLQLCCPRLDVLVRPGAEAAAPSRSGPSQIPQWSAASDHSSFWHRAPKPCHNIIHPPPPPPSFPNPTQPALILLTGHSTTTLSLSRARTTHSLVHAELRRKSAPPPPRLQPDRVPTVVIPTAKCGYRAALNSRLQACMQYSSV